MSGGENGASGLWLGVYAGCLLAAFGLSVCLTALSRRLGLQWGLLDRPAGRKAHEQPIPVTGGWALFGTFILLAGAGGWVGPALAAIAPEGWAPLPDYLRNLVGVRRQLMGLILGAGFIFAVGALDDARPLGPKLKLAAQALSVVPLLAVGVSIRLFLPWEALGWALTIAWCVALMNAFNFIDNMDGLCATAAATIAAVLAMGALQGGSLWLPAMYLSLAGALLGFLVFNFHPATIFLGDAGSLTVGYLLAAFSILTTYYESGQPTGLPVLIPLAVMGVPLFDAASVLWIRWRRGAPLMVGDQNHFSHRLRAMGLSVRQTALTIGLLTAATGLLALPLRHLPPGAAALHLGALGMLFGVVGALELAGRRNRTP